MIRISILRLKQELLAIDVQDALATNDKNLNSEIETQIFFAGTLANAFCYE